MTDINKLETCSFGKIA